MQVRCLDFKGTVGFQQQSWRSVDHKRSCSRRWQYRGLSLLLWVSEDVLRQPSGLYVLRPSGKLAILTSRFQDY